MLELLERQKTLTANQWKIIVAAILGDMTPTPRLIKAQQHLMDEMGGREAPGWPAMKGFSRPSHAALTSTGDV